MDSDEEELNLNHTDSEKEEEDCNYEELINDLVKSQTS